VDVPHPTDPAERLGVIEVRDGNLVDDLQGPIAGASVGGSKPVSRRAGTRSDGIDPTVVEQVRVAARFPPSDRPA
jgi:hypothetical protein